MDRLGLPGARLEQIDFVFDFGGVYEKYRGRVPDALPGIVQLGCSSLLKPTAVPSAPVLDATGLRPVRHQAGSCSILAEVDEFAAPEMTGLAKRQPGSTACHSPEPRQCLTPYFIWAKETQN